MAGGLVRFIRLQITGDNKSAVKAFEGTAVASDKTGKAVDRTSAKTKEAAASNDVLAESAHKVRGAVASVAGIAGLGGLVFGIKDVIEAGTKWQQQQAQLSNALKNTGAGMQNLGVLSRAVEESATHGGFAPPDQLSAMTQFIRLTGSATKAQALNTEATALARGANMSYSDAVSAVARIQTGQVGRLAKLTGVIIPVTTHVQSLTAAQKKLNPELLIQAKLLDKQATAALANSAIMGKYKNATQDFGKTYAGAMSNARNAIDELAQKIGTALLPYVTMAAQWLTRMVDVVEQHWPQISRVASSVFGTVKKVLSETWPIIAGLAGAFIALKVATAAAAVAQGAYEAVAGVLFFISLAKDVTSLAEAWYVLDASMEANPIGVVIVAIGALVGGVIYAYMHFQTFRTVVNSVLSWLASAVSTVVSFVTKHWKLLGTILLAPLSPLFLIITHLKTVKKLVGDITSLPGKALHGVTGAFHSLGFHTGGVVPAFAGGGVVGGYGNYDTVPAMLTPGEGILTKQAMAAIGPQGLNQLNSGGSVAQAPIIIEPATIQVMLNERVLTEAVARFSAKQAARL